MTDKCRLCDEREVECPKSGLCKRCYAWMHYWQGMSVTRFMERMEQIGMWKHRGEKVANRVKGTRRKNVGEQ